MLDLIVPLICMDLFNGLEYLFNSQAAVGLSDLSMIYIYIYIYILIKMIYSKNNNYWNAKYRFYDS